MNFFTTLVAGSLLVFQLCAAQNPIQDYVVKNEVKDRISHDQRIQDRLQDRKEHDYRVLNKIAYDQSVRGPLVGDAQLQNTLQYRIASDQQAQGLLNDRIAYDKRVLSGVEGAGVYAYPGYYQGYQQYPGYYQQGYYSQYPGYYQQAAPSIQPVVAPPVPAPVVVKSPAVTYSGGAQVPIVSYENDINPDGSYKYSYATGNGIAAQEEGAVKNYGKDLGEGSSYAVGSFAYTSPEGIPVSVSYTADENGFHAKTAFQSSGAVGVEPSFKYKVVPQPVPVAAVVPESALAINPKLGRPLFSEPKTP